MQIDIQNQRENKLLDRTEVRFTVNHTGEPTPTRDAVREALATDLDTDKDRVILHRLKTEFGRATSKGYAKLYPSSDAARSQERRYVLARNDMAEGPASEASETTPDEPEPEEEADEDEESGEETGEAGDEGAD